MTNTLIRPGYDVVIGASTDRRAPDPHPSTMFFVGTSLRGTLARGYGIGNLSTFIGARQNWSSLPDEAFSALAESTTVGTSPWAFSRVLGPAAAAASLIVNDATTPTPVPSIKIVAKEPGGWVNGATATFTTPSSGKRRFVIAFAGTTLATSPATDTIADWVTWSADPSVPFTVIPQGGGLPPASSGSPGTLAGGTDDRASINTASWQAAFDAIPEWFGPGLLFVDSTDPAVRKIARAHGAANKRVPFFKGSAGESVADLGAEQDAMRADDPSHAQIGSLWGGYSWTRPIPSEPQRRPSSAAVQMGNQSRVLRESYVSKTAFGPTNAPLKTVIKLDQEFSDADRTALYAAGVNVLTYNGASFASWGYCTGSLQPVDQDLNHQIVRMCLAWEGQGVVDSIGGQFIDAQLKASVHGKLKSICDRFVEARAISPGSEVGADDSGYVIDVETVNSAQTAAARQFYVRLAYRDAATADWAELIIYPNAPDAAAIA